MTETKMSNTAGQSLLGLGTVLDAIGSAFAAAVTAAGEQGAAVARVFGGPAALAIGLGAYLDNRNKPNAEADAAAALTAYGVSFIAAEWAGSVVLGIAGGALATVGITLSPVVAAAIGGALVFMAINAAAKPLFEGAESFSKDQLSSIDWELCPNLGDERGQAAAV
jgi:hypothetical protein